MFTSYENGLFSGLDSKLILFTNVGLKSGPKLISNLKPNQLWPKINFNY